MDLQNTLDTKSFCIAVIGMNGIGKSHFGKNLAKKLHMKWIDTDIEFRKLHGKEQPYIDAHGWKDFRKLEAAIVCKALRPNHVVIVSGGAVESEEVQAALKEHAIVLWMQAEQKQVHALLQRAKLRRPEFQSGITAQAVNEHLVRRNPLYESIADIVLHARIRFGDQTRVAITLLHQYLGLEQPPAAPTNV